MSFLVPCPMCGPRPVDEFSWGGELTPRPAPGSDDRELFRTLYMRRNVAGPQSEWWCHSSGCREWFLATRDTSTGEVLSVTRPAPHEAAPSAHG
jgi:sarcosine oxidase subunit delta